MVNGIDETALSISEAEKVYQEYMTGYSEMTYKTQIAQHQARLDALNNVDSTLLSISEAEKVLSEAQYALIESGIEEQITAYELQLEKLESIDYNIFSLSEAIGEYTEALSDAIASASTSSYTASALTSSYTYLTSNVPAMASGGTVTGPTLALLGEGGEPEYVTPDSQMQGVKDALNRMLERMVVNENSTAALVIAIRDLYDLLDDVTRGISQLHTISEVA